MELELIRMEPPINIYIFWASFTVAFCIKPRTLLELMQQYVNPNQCTET